MCFDKIQRKKEYNKDMLIQIACLIVGFVLLIKGADVFVERHLNYHQK